MSISNTKTIKQFIQHYKLGNPFKLNNEKAYQCWREEKLENYPTNIEQLIVEIKNPLSLNNAEKDKINQLILKTNMAIYVSHTKNITDKNIPAQLGKQFGLTKLDNNRGADEGISSLKVVNDKWQKAYIPYTDKPIHWHTDGYYNSQEQQVNAVILHCVSKAATGGENSLLDHEIAYIHLRDTNPDYIHALMQDNVMSIPANIVDNKEIRPTRTGKVFSIDRDDNLHMRYTARTRSINWQTDTLTQSAIKSLAEYLKSDLPYIYQATLQTGMGLICNNVLHNRSAFTEDSTHKRLLYRLRYYNKIEVLV